LHDLAKEAIRASDNVAEQQFPSFSLLEDGFDVTPLLTKLSSDCCLDPTNIRDAYPCTPLQKGLMSLASQQTGDCLVQDVLELPSNLEVEDICAAWEQVVRVLPILLTSLI
jgi:hypothetical protein